MSTVTKKNKSYLESLSEEDVLTLIKKCYRDKLIYGYVQWKLLDRKIFSKRFSVNTFKNIWRIINKSFDDYYGKYENDLSQVEVEAQEVLWKNKEEKKKRKADKEKFIQIYSSKLSVSLSNISLLRKFSKVNSSLHFRNSNSNYYSPLQNNLNNSYGNMLKSVCNDEEKNKENYVKKDVLKSDIHNNSNINSNVDYIKKNINYIKTQSDLLDLYFLIISLIHDNKRFLLLRKIDEIYEKNILKCYNNINNVYNNYILNIIRMIYEMCAISNIMHNNKTSQEQLNKNISKYMNKKTNSNVSYNIYSSYSTNLRSYGHEIYNKSNKHTHHNHFINSKCIDNKQNIIIIETNEKIYKFDKMHLNYDIFYDIYKNNLTLKNNQVITFFLPLPKNKPNHLTYKNNNFYYFDDIIYLNKNLSDDVYNYIYILQKYFLSFKFWYFYLRYQGIDKMKKLFNNELSNLFFYLANYDKINNKSSNISFYQNKGTNKQKKKNYLLLFEYNIKTLINLCLHILKIYLNKEIKINISYFQIIKILNLCLNPTRNKKIMRHYVVHMKFVHSIFMKLIKIKEKKKIKKK
ncbi:hypothetical protein C923_05231 [Plasmodium falciparum UGT5.1]|uniref:Uncharacterized protein n=7 Tax=Plasmodium falciparum TaxID=5833 RepID=Q8ILW3_PLAF7|nr:conserved Plasmodium protein, unknown function [Plasmodium falciparum 3D7]ETW16215.1 hypothetical protein PFFVO_04750 [Plasmodium falciparum Vietnam Oak-Knoll (FVO)]ETW34157.1 hypothetical protein PFTANZ_05091 [Plasmodium falciparum Tanzania (2000708)]ETW40284.1 hypothetical protein PFNF135_05327 [Plasmodium falciparum NF135/5.C10]EUR64689.1 hypothetical protein PFBG_05163 [Plasmodium falciparum 7G8]EWC74126.1 hypothetical protein C923_05231 [Plasmodium falciparum UGT5.1]EWC86087.1 hypothe|eukprot:XP_001348303.1 conserved Plasmodium protein, unknown function [Plasmodium falciparum 3D7]